MTVNIAVIGTGQITDMALLPALSKIPAARLWSVLGRRPERVQRLIQRHQAAAAQPAPADLAELLADPELHAVIVASPDGLHAEHTIATAKAGKHILVEKPMATSVADASAMIDAAQGAGVVLAVAYHLRWHAGHRALHAAIAQGLLGELRHIRVQWSWLAPDASNWRAQPELGHWWSLAGVGTHCLDLARWFASTQQAGNEVIQMRSLINRSIWQGPHDETAVIALQFASGMTAELCSSVLFQAPPRLELYGSQGYALCDHTLGGHGGGHIYTHQGAFPFQASDPYLGEIQDFVTAIQLSRPPAVDGIEGRRNIELLNQAVE